MNAAARRFCGTAPRSAFRVPRSAFCVAAAHAAGVVRGRSAPDPPEAQRSANLSVLLQTPQNADVERGTNVGYCRSGPAIRHNVTQ